MRKGQFALNFNLLCCFRTPQSPWDLQQQFDFCYTAIFKEIRKFQRLGLITSAYNAKSSKNGLKTFYVLTKKGQVLLELFPQGAERTDLLDAISYEMG